MKHTPLQEHPLYIWLKKDKDYNAIYKFVNFIPSLKENTLSPSDNIILFNQTYFFLHNQFDSEGNINTMLGKGISDNGRMMKTFEYLQELMPLDVNRKSVMWQDRFTTLMDQFKPMSDFFDRDYPDYIKSKGFKKHGAELLEKLLLKLTHNTCVNKTRFTEVVDLLDSRFKRYNAKPNWAELMKNQPSLFMALYANKEGYELKHQEFKFIFSSLSSIRRGTLNGINKDDAYTLGNMFAELLANSLYFKNSLAPTRNIEATLQKFLDEKPVNNPISQYDYFINAALLNPVYSMKKLVLDFDKNNRVKTMGKSNLNKHEAEVYEQKQEEQLAQAPRPKKMKI